MRWWCHFQTPVTTFSGANNTPATNFVTVKSVWAEIEQLSGEEIVWPNQVQAYDKYRITVRWFAGIRQAQRIVHGTQIFNVYQVNEIGNLHHIVEIDCAEMDPEM